METGTIEQGLGASAQESVEQGHGASAQVTGEQGQGAPAPAAEGQAESHPPLFWKPRYDCFDRSAYRKCATYAAHYESPDFESSSAGVELFIVGFRRQLLPITLFKLIPSYTQRMAVRTASLNKRDPLHYMTYTYAVELWGSSEGLQKLKETLRVD